MRMTVAGVGAIIVPRKGEAQPKVSTPQLIVGFIILALIIGVPAYLIYNFFFREGAPTVPEFQRVENEIMVSTSEVQSTSTFTHTGESSKEMRRYIDYHYGNSDGNLAEDEVNGFLTALETKERQKIQTEYAFIDGESGQIAEVDYYVISCPFGSIDTLGDFVFGLRETISWTLKEKDEHTYSKTGLGDGDVIYFSVPTGWEIESVDGLSSESMSPDQKIVTGSVIADTPCVITFVKVPLKPTTLTVSPSTFPIMSEETQNLTATLTSSGGPVTGKAITWSIFPTGIGSLSSTTGTSVTYMAPTVTVETSVKITASFAGDESYKGSSGTSWGTITPPVLYLTKTIYDPTEFKTDLPELDIVRVCITLEGSSFDMEIEIHDDFPSTNYRLYNWYEDECYLYVIGIDTTLDEKWDYMLSLNVYWNREIPAYSRPDQPVKHGDEAPIDAYYDRTANAIHLQGPLSAIGSSESFYFQALTNYYSSDLGAVTLDRAPDKTYEHFP